MPKSSPAGFIAITSALVISAVLLLIAIGGSFNGFYSRINGINAENKERSYQLARACVSHALLLLAENQDFSGDATTTLSSTGETCYVSSVATTGSYSNEEVHFSTRSYVGSAYTTLEVTSNAHDPTLTRLIEVVHF